MSFHIFILFNICGVAMNVYALYCILTRKRYFIIDMAVWAATLIVTFSLAMVLNTFISNEAAYFFPLGCLYLFPTILLFKEHWKVKIFTFFMVFSISQYITLTFSFIFQLYSLSPSIGKAIYMITACIEIGVFFLVYYYFSNALKPVLKIINEESAIFLLLPMGSCILLALIRIRGIFDFYSLIIMFLATCTLLSAIYLINFATHLMNRKIGLENQLSLQLDHYKKLTVSVQQSYSYHHDIRHHLAGIHELLGKQEIAATEAYLDSMHAQYAESYMPIFCTNKYVDAVVAHYFKIAEQASITLSIKLSLPEETGIEALDLCVIIGNCFENAIEACLAVRDAEERQISIQAKIMHGYMAITLKNSCVNELKRQKNYFISSKQPGRIGIGLESVHLLVDKYDGNMQISTEQDKFIAAISLKIPMLDHAAE